MARPKVWSRGAARDVPEGKVRRSQVVTTFGPGALVDLVEHAVMVGGLELWRYPRGVPLPALDEPRLRERLERRFAAAGRPLSESQPFRQPPVGDDKEPKRDAGIVVLEFPRWFVCQNPACRALVHREHTEVLERGKDGRHLHRCDRFRKPEPCVPVRFVAACRRGHVQELPWVAFAHRNGERCQLPQLRLLEGATGDFSEIVVQCACGQRERLSKAAVPGGIFPCDGERPWLGPDGQEPCSDRVRLLVRSASNAYFTQVESALTIPEPRRELEAKISELRDFLGQAELGDLPVLRRVVPRVGEALAGFSDEEVAAAIAARRSGAPLVREPLRSAEFRQLVQQPLETPGQLPGPEPFFARLAVLPDGLPAGVGRLVLVPKLREVRVQVGFTRIEPVAPDLQGEYDLGVQTAALGLAQDWLPANELLGEGFFVQLDEEAVRAWEAREAVRRREEELAAGYRAWKETVPAAPDFPGARFYLLHSLAHLLISAVSLECGYAASAIRERLYCAPAGAPAPMAGLLLYTGTPGTEGTLGGLVEQGRRLAAHLRRAWDLGILCSNDPVCATHSPLGDPAERHLEGAACHGCLFLPEPCCERFNRYLDRALVVPTLQHGEGLAFFAVRP